MTFVSTHMCGESFVSTHRCGESFVSTQRCGESFVSTQTFIVAYYSFFVHLLIVSQCLAELGV